MLNFIYFKSIKIQIHIIDLIRPGSILKKNIQFNYNNHSNFQKFISKHPANAHAKRLKK